MTVRILSTLLCVAAFAATATAQPRVTARESVGVDGAQLNGDSYVVNLTPNGRYVVFLSATVSLDGCAGRPKDSDPSRGDIAHVYVRDRLSGIVECVSKSSSGAPGNGSERRAAISADGNIVAFVSASTNLVVPATSDWQVFVRNRSAGTTTLVSVAPDGITPANAHSPDAVGISDDGRFVVFASHASNLVPGGTTLDRKHVYLRNLETGSTTLISVASDGVAEGNGNSGAPSMTPDGRLIAFASAASNLLAGVDANDRTDIFVRDMTGGTTQLVSVASSGSGADHDSGRPDISANGRFVAFSSGASNLLPGVVPSHVVFIRDLIASSTASVPVRPADDTDNQFALQISLSGDGRFVAFLSFQTPGTIGGAPGHLVHDRALHATVRVAGGSSGDTRTSPFPAGPVLRRDGLEMLVDSMTQTLVPADNNGRMDVFAVAVPHHEIDVGVYRRQTGDWVIAQAFDGRTYTTGWGSPADDDRPVAADYDGDGRFDAAVYRPATGEWFILQSSGGSRTAQWGSPSYQDQPVPADYDGDGRADVAVYRGTTGQWLIALSSGDSRVVNWGAPSLGDIPVPADYDADGRDDVAVYRRSTGEWFIAWPTGTQPPIDWGAPTLGDIPVPGDYDGDGDTDVAIYRGSTGEWFIRLAAGSLRRDTFGSPALSDVPVSADYDGDGRTDVAVRRPSTGEWFIFGSATQTLRVVTWGSDALGDVPITLPFALR